MWPHDLKLQRARQHLKELEAEIGRWVKTDGYTISVEPDPKPPLYIVTPRILRPIEEDPFSFLIGDFLQNARAALDYIAFALGDSGAPGGAMEPSVAGRSMFPIIGDEEGGFSGRGPDLFAAAAENRLSTVPEAARTVIERLQPYYVGGLAWQLEPLWILNELARFDRHRFLHAAAARSGELRLDPATSRNVRISELEVYAGGFFFFEDGEEARALLARVTAEPANPRREMHMNFQTGLHIGLDSDTLPPTLDGGTADVPLNITLASIERDVRKALEALGRFLPKEPPPPF